MAIVQEDWGKISQKPLAQLFETTGNEGYYGTGFSEKYGKKTGIQEKRSEGPAKVLFWSKDLSTSPKYG